MLRQLSGNSKSAFLVIVFERVIIIALKSLSRICPLNIDAKTSGILVTMNTGPSK